MAAASSATSLSLSLDAILSHSPSSSSSSSSHPTYFISPPLPRSLSLPKPHCHPFLFLRRTAHQPHAPRSLPPAFEPLPLPSPAVFLDPDAVRNLQALDKFCYSRELDRGSLEVRLMGDAELGATVQILAESFAEATWMPVQYVQFLGLVVRQYLLEKRRVVPHAATLVGLYKAGGAGGGEEEEVQVVATAEVWFDPLGFGDSPLTPAPPRDCPYICNMAVKKEFRRRRIGWQLLQACEELISVMNPFPLPIHLHCRLTDKGPYSMYRKAGYQVVERDNVLVWLRFQRRKYLMCKLPPSDSLGEDRMPRE